MTTTTTATDNKIAFDSSNVYLFKNGYGMIVKAFELPPNKDNPDQCIELLDPPSNPVHGTFWIQSISNKSSITSIRTNKTSTHVNKDCLNVQELLEGNLGQNVELLVTDGVTQTKEWISGVIKSIKRFDDQESDDEQATNPNFPHVYSASSRTLMPVPFQNPSGDLVLFETIDGDLMGLSLSDIKSIRSKKPSKLSTTYQRKISKKCLSIKYRNESGTTDQGLMNYLTFGITWAPTYNVVLLISKDPSIKKLRLSSKAVILNDTETLNVRNLYCVVGYPNLSKFASVVDPMISGSTVQEFLNQLATSESSRTGGQSSLFNQITSNSVMTQCAMPPAFPTNNPTLHFPDENQQDTNADDLHVYEFQNLVLEKKGRLMLPIFDIELDYKDVYHCKIDGTQAQNNYLRNSTGASYEEVWHSIEFENLSNFVWTTAPIVVTKGEQEQQFLAQETLTYTSKGTTAFVKLTKALDILVRLDEKVTNTDVSRSIFYQQNYQKELIEGKLILINSKSVDTTLVINLLVQGEMSNYSLAPKKEITKTSEQVVNQQRDIRWEVTIKPKQTLEIRYSRSFYKRV